MIIKASAMVFCILTCMGCSGLMGDSAPTEYNKSGSPQNPPLPRVKSILPLQKGNAWTYSYTAYDTAGETVLRREELDLSLPNVFGLKDDSTLVNIVADYYNGYNWADSTYEWVYAYEWEEYGRGSFVVYRDIDVPVRGVYIIGDYRPNVRRIFAHPQLWLKYPAAKGDTWSFFDFDSSGDSTRIDMEVVSTTAQFYFPDTNRNSPSALTFLTCYLYKEVAGTVTSYYYYHSDYGAIGFSNYSNGRLISTYIMTNYWNDTYYYYWD